MTAPRDHFLRVEEENRRQLILGFREYFRMPGSRALYRYDFGDGWTHDLVFEGSSAANAEIRYPTCLTGARACPPEDVRGVPGYEDLMAGDPELTEWAEGFDPEAFDPETIQFWDPKERLDMALGGDE